MHSNSILNSSLLDIVFHNRNKDYGAYVLRKEYNRRLSVSLITMLMIVSLFAAWQMLCKNPPIDLKTIQVIGADISPFRPFEKPALEKTSHSQVKSSKAADVKPVIVKDFRKKKLPVNILVFISKADNVNETPPDEPGTRGTGENNTGKTENKEIGRMAATVIANKNAIDNSPEVLPQFPGGLSELLKFLKHNLNSPRDMEDGEEIAVKVKFIVSFNGDLVGFNVVESGGESFDNEVIRVLKKMPKWVPGKTRGESVSTYYIIPVKFAAAN